MSLAHHPLWGGLKETGGATVLGFLPQRVTVGRTSAHMHWELGDAVKIVQRSQFAAVVPSMATF